MHFEHEPGDKFFIDYAGKKISHVEYGTGEIIWTAGIYPAIQQHIEGVLSQNTYPETLYRASVGILAMTKKVAKERLIKACETGIQMNSYNYEFIDRILIRHL